MILKSEQIFRSGKHDIFIEAVNKITMSANNDKIMHLIDLIETFANQRSKHLLREKEEIKYNNIIKQYKNQQL